MKEEMEIWFKCNIRRGKDQWIRKCKEKGCDRIINKVKNKSGYCEYHYELWRRKKKRELEKMENKIVNKEIIIRN